MFRSTESTDRTEKNLELQLTQIEHEMFISKDYTDRTGNFICTAYAGRRGNV